MALINLIICSTRAGNTGLSKCSPNDDPTVASILIPRGDGIETTAAVDLPTFVAGRMHNNTYAQRWHLFGPWVELANNDAEPTTTEYQDGSQSVNRLGYYRTGYRHKNGPCAHKAYRKFAEREEQFDVIEIKKNLNGQYYFAMVDTINSAGNSFLGGFSLSRIDIPNRTKGTFADAPASWVNFDFADANEYNEQYATIAFQDKNGKPVNLLKYLANQTVRDVAIQNTNQLTAGVVQLLFAEGCSQVAVTNTITAGLLNVFNAATNAAITITSLTPVDAARGLYTLTLDTTDTDYPAAGGQIRINMKDVSTVFAAIGNYLESNDLFLTV